MATVRKLKPAAGKQETVVDHIVDTIKDGIRLGQYVPGQRLIEHDFLSTRGFSRGPLREALRRLEAEGAVMLEKNRGAMVRRYSRADIASVYDVRELLEPEAARLAAERVAEDAELRERFDGSRSRMRRALKETVEEYSRENTRFHVLVAEASGNPWLARIIETLQLPVDRLAVFHFVSTGATRNSIGEHEKIIDAVLAGDAARAEKTMRIHLRSSRKMVLGLPDRAFH